jgi:hypothetical protein
MFVFIIFLFHVLNARENCVSSVSRKWEMKSFGKLSLEIMQLQLVLHRECNTETFLLTMQEAVNDLRLILHCPGDLADSSYQSTSYFQQMHCTSK